MSRSAGTLSGGESQRIRLASQIGSGLTGVLYVLDEPSIGLHQRDNDRLLLTLKNLRDQGNTVIVVEHDEEAIREADYVFDIGPGAGVHGGQIVSHGRPLSIQKDQNSLTGRYLSGKLKIPIPKERRSGNGKNISVVKAAGNNLKKITADFPLGKFVCVTGVSGGGKSTLTIETLFKTASMRLNGAKQTPAPCETIKGLEFWIRLLILISDQLEGPLDQTLQPILAHLHPYAIGLQDCQRRKLVDINLVDLALM